jgi:Zn-dependent protease/CBS domain-containing protein
MTNSFPIARIAGVEIRIHVSWAFILILIIVTVASQVASMDPTSSTAAQWAIAVVAGFLFLSSAIAHELGHALVARRRGVPVDSVVVTFLGAAVPSDLTAKTPRDEILIAAAGPLVSILIGGALLGLSLLFGAVGSGLANIVAEVALIVGALDLVIGLLDLIPAFPLDGGRIVRGIGWARSGEAVDGLHLAARSGRIVGLLIGGASIVTIVAIDTIDGLMVALCGWFLVSTARSLEQTAGLELVLDGMRVGDVMDRDVATISPTLTVDTFAGQILDGSAAMAIPVMRDHELLGLIGLREIRRLRRDKWASTRAEDAMIGVRRLPVIGPDTSVRGAIEAMARTRLDGLPVLEGGALIGVVTRKTLAKAIRAKAEHIGVAPT